MCVCDMCVQFVDCTMYILLGFHTKGGGLVGCWNFHDFPHNPHSSIYKIMYETDLYNHKIN